MLLTRRKFITKAGVTTGAIGVLGTATGEPISTANAKTILTISEGDGELVDYDIYVEGTDLQFRPLADGADKINRNFDQNFSVASGSVYNGSDAYEFRKQIISIRLQGAGQVEIRCNGGFGFHGNATVNIMGEGYSPPGLGAVYEFCVTDNISAPGDGSLESAYEYINKTCAGGNALNGEDHFNTQGRLKELRVDFREDMTFEFDRNKFARW